MKDHQKFIFWNLCFYIKKLPGLEEKKNSIGIKTFNSLPDVYTDISVIWFLCPKKFPVKSENTRRHAGTLNSINYKGCGLLIKISLWIPRQKTWNKGDENPGSDWNNLTISLFWIKIYNTGTGP